MKTKKISTSKEFDTVKTFREIKDKISKELSEMSTKQILDYLNKNSRKFKLEK